MTVDIIYEVKRHDGSEDELFLMETELTEEEAILYNEALEQGKSLNEVKGLEAAAKREYEYVARALTYQALELGDEYVNECIGSHLMNPDKLNELVHSRDQVTLEFFGFENMSDEKLALWDANLLEMLPPEYFFNPDAEGPFDLKWDLVCRFPEPSEMEKTEENE